MKSLIVIPTFNEKENVGPMIAALSSALPGAHVLICDDDSPDGTAKSVEEIAARDTRVHLLSGPRRSGLGRAYVKGFQWGIESGYDIIGQMDCDFSHDPAKMPVLFRALDEFDLAIGSRYLLGGGTANWSVYRRLISRGGSLYARTILNMPVSDFTGGFKAWRRQTLEAIDLPSIRSEGYLFQIETTYRALKKGMRLAQIPIVFEDRRVGASKMSRAILLEAVTGVWKMRFRGE